MSFEKILTENFDVLNLEYFTSIILVIKLNENTNKVGNYVLKQLIGKD